MSRMCSSTKLTVVLTLCAWYVFHVFGCALSVYHLSSHWVRVCLLWVYVVIEHMVNSKLFQISTSWTHTNPEHTLAAIEILHKHMCIWNQCFIHIYIHYQRHNIHIKWSHQLRFLTTISHENHLLISHPTWWEIYSKYTRTCTKDICVSKDLWP